MIVYVSRLIATTKELASTCQANSMMSVENQEPQIPDIRGDKHNTRINSTGLLIEYFIGRLRHYTGLADLHN